MVSNEWEPAGAPCGDDSPAHAELERPRTPREIDASRRFYNVQLPEDKLGRLGLKREEGWIIKHNPGNPCGGCYIAASHLYLIDENGSEFGFYARHKGEIVNLENFDRFVFSDRDWAACIASRLSWQAD